MNAIKTFALATAAVAAPLMLTACGGEYKVQDNAITTHDITTVFSGDVFDAVTNTKINLYGNKEASVIVWQGDKKLKAKFDEDTGLFTVKGIATSIDGNITHKVTATVPGYQPATAYVAFNAATNSGVNSLHDETVYMVANIPLYPTTLTAQTYKVCLNYESDNIKVDTAKVELVPTAAANVLNATTQQVLTLATLVDKPVIAAEFANGCASFDGSKLTLGAEYDIRVRDAKLGDAPLALLPTGTHTFVAGVDQLVQSINLAGTTINTGARFNLFVTAFNNEDIYAIHSTEGKLIITFNQNVEAVNKSAVTVTGGNIGTLVNTQNVDVQVSGTVVTLAPNFLTGKTMNDVTGTTKLTYDNLTVRLAGTNNAVKQITFSVFNPAVMSTSTGVAVDDYKEVRFKPDF